MNQAYQNFVNSLKPSKMANPVSSGQVASTGITPSSPSAVTPTKQAPVASTPVASPTADARSAYTASLATPSSPIAPQGSAPSVAPTPVSSAPQAPATPATGSPDTTPSYVQSYQDALAKYTKSLIPSEKVTAAATSLADIQNEIDKASLEARTQYQNTLDTPGMLKAGAQSAATQLDRRNTANLANLAVREGGAARTLMALQGADTSGQTAAKNLLEASKPLQVGGSYYDIKTGKLIPDSSGGYTLSAGQSRYDASGKLIAGPGTTGSSVIGGEYVAGVNPTVDAWANRIQNGSAKITDIPASQASLRNQVTQALDAMGNSADGKPTTTELGKQALQTAQSLLEKFKEGKGTSAVGKSGALNSFGYGLIPGTERANFVTDFNSLKSQLSLEGVKYLKGQGQVSDAERALLSAAVTKLNLTQSEDEFKKTLQGIVDRLSGNAPKSSEGQGVAVTAPDGSVHTFPDKKSADAFKKAANIQ